MAVKFIIWRGRSRHFIKPVGLRTVLGMSYTLCLYMYREDSWKRQEKFECE